MPLTNVPKSLKTLMAFMMAMAVRNLATLELMGTVIVLSYQSASRKIPFTTCGRKPNPRVSWMVCAKAAPIKWARWMKPSVKA